MYRLRLPDRKYKLSLTQQSRNGYAMWSKAAVISSRNPGTSISINLATFPASWLACRQFCLRYRHRYSHRWYLFLRDTGMHHREEKLIAISVTRVWTTCTCIYFYECTCIHSGKCHCKSFHRSAMLMSIEKKKGIENVALLKILAFSSSLYIRFFNTDLCTLEIATWEMRSVL